MYQPLSPSYPQYCQGNQEAGLCAGFSFPKIFHKVMGLYDFFSNTYKLVLKSSRESKLAEYRHPSNVSLSIQGLTGNQSESTI